MKKLILILGMVLLAGCSTKFTYNNLDWLVHWYVDDYVELSDQQEKLFDQHFANWMDWHRNQELAKYVEHLKRLRSDIEKGTLTAQSIADHLWTSRQHWERLRDHVSPELAELAKNLTDDQVKSLFDELNEENDDIAEQLAEAESKSEAENEKARIADIEDGISDYIGKLSDKQQAIIKQHAPDFHGTRALWLRYRRDFQQAARALIDKRNDMPDFEAQFIALLTHPDEFRSTDYRQLQLQNTALYGRMLEQVFYTLSDKQKNKLINKIDDMISDFEYLMRND
ncbi:DUF6279 family lipoprotein [Alteromonas sp. AMM-1]|uniref:DUF6279 family lipoprotein n=1 Tax=Alteromonas sp. AMM-1 TaxID=3394233 RepID=UPI0039A52E39